MISEFMSLTREEKAELITEMVTDLAIETGYPIETCINLIAEYRCCSNEQIKDYIKSVDPVLLYNVAFINPDGSKMYINQVDEEVKRVLNNKLFDLVSSLPVEITTTWLRKTIEEGIYLNELR